MLRKVGPVTERMSTVVSIYFCSMVGYFFYSLFFDTEGPIWSRDNMTLALREGVKPLWHGFLLLLVIWFLLWLLWRFGGEAKSAAAREAYKAKLPEIERHLYEIEEERLKLPDGPTMKKRGLRFFNSKKG